jgi:hypothetical protein
MLQEEVKYQYKFLTFDHRRKEDILELKLGKVKFVPELN